jgi:hypothetical protein
MKKLSFWSISILYLALPALALGSDPSYQHSFKTTYANGSSQEGTLTVGKTKNCMRVALPPDEVDEDNDLQDQSIGNDEIIFCKNPQPVMTSLDKRNKTYQRFDQAMVQAMHGQREQMMKQIGIEPGSGQEKELFKSFGGAMGMVKQKQRERMEETLQDESMSPEERAEAEAYMKKNFSDSPSPSSMEIATKVTDLHRRDSQKGISCKWYKIEMSGLVHMVNRVCAADWSDIPGGQPTKDVMYAWMNFMKDMSQGTLMKNNAYEAIMKINGLRLISIKEDGNGNVVSEERYQKSDSVEISYLPPTEYVEETMDMMGQKQNRRARKMIVPQMKGMSTSPELKEPPIASIDATKLKPGECKKTKEGIVCNEEEFATGAQSNDSDDSDIPTDNTEDMKEKVGDLLEGMGLGNVFGN